MRRIARPMVALARKLGPKQPLPPCMPISLRVRAVDDHERRDAVHRALHAVHVELVAQHELEPAQHHRQVFRLAARHQRVDRDGAHRRRLHRGRHAADQLIGIARRACEHPSHARFRRRDDGQAVRPRLFEEELEFVYFRFIHRPSPSQTS